ncbi:MAG: choline/ethanolamine kinase family protein [Hyphomicrobiaceae bacterium]
MGEAANLVRRLRCWQEPVSPEPLSGGITNTNFSVPHKGRRYFVRVGDDIPVHQVMRFNERAASEAAFAAGISPQVIHSEPGALVFDFIEGKTFAASDVREEANLRRIVPLVKRVHTELPKHLRGPALIFNVFHIARDYAHTLHSGGSRHASRLQDLLDLSARLERDVGPVDLVYGHNDLLPANFIDDGHRIWLIDWDYGGFNSPLFDLANLASNNELSADQETWLLETYYGWPPNASLRRRYSAMKCASLLRETMWSMVSEIHSTLDFDYKAYTADYLGRLERTIEAHRNL